MTNVYQLRGGAPHEPENAAYTIDGDLIAFASLTDLERLLTESVLSWSDPTAAIRIVALVAHALLDESMTDEKCRVRGWESAAVYRQRGRDLVKLISQLPPINRAGSGQ